MSARTNRLHGGAKAILPPIYIYILSKMTE
jgi:hypothetical protein